MVDTTIITIAMMIDRSHITIRTERFTPLLRQLVEYMNPKMIELNTSDLSEQNLKETFWFYNFYGQVMQNKGFRVPKLLKTWMRMRSRRSTYRNLTDLTYALRY